MSRSLQAEKIDFTALGHFVDTTLSRLDDAVLPAANWVLELLDVKDDLQAATGTSISMLDITSFMDRVAKPFITKLKNTISSWFVSQDVVSSFSTCIFDQNKIPASDSSDLTSCGDHSVDILINHYGTDQPQRLWRVMNILDKLLYLLMSKQNGKHFIATYQSSQKEPYTHS